MPDQEERVQQHIKDNPGCTPTEAQRALRIAPGTLQGNVSRLESEGQVERGSHLDGGRIYPKEK